MSKLSLTAQEIKDATDKLEKNGVTFGRAVFKGIMSAAQENSIDKNLIERIFKRLDIGINEHQIGEFHGYEPKLKADGGFGDEKEYYFLFHPEQKEVYEPESTKAANEKIQARKQFLNDYDKSVFGVLTEKVRGDGNCFLYSVAKLQNLNTETDKRYVSDTKEKFAEIFEKWCPPGDNKDLVVSIDSLRKNKNYVEPLAGAIAYNLCFKESILVTVATENGFSAILVKNAEEYKVEFLDANNIQNRKNELVGYKIIALKHNHYQPVQTGSSSKYLNKLCGIFTEHKFVNPDIEYLGLKEAYKTMEEKSRQFKKAKEAIDAYIGFVGDKLEESDFKNLAAKLKNCGIEIGNNTTCIAAISYLFTEVFKLAEKREKEDKKEDKKEKPEKKASDKKIEKLTHISDMLKCCINKFLPSASNEDKKYIYNAIVYRMDIDNETKKLLSSTYNNLKSLQNYFYSQFNMGNNKNVETDRKKGKDK